MQAPTPRDPADDLEPRLFVVGDVQGQAPAGPAGHELGTDRHVSPSHPAVRADEARHREARESLSAAYAAAVSVWHPVRDLPSGDVIWDGVCRPLLQAMYRLDHPDE